MISQCAVYQMPSLTSSLTFQSVPEAHVGSAVHGSGVVGVQAEGELHLR